MIDRHLGPVVRVAVLALLLVAPANAFAQIAVTSSVNGPNITLSWSPVPGADTYAVRAGAAPGAPAITLPATATGFTISAPFTGTFYMQVFAGAGLTPIAASNEFAVTVSSLSVPPATPTTVEAYSYCGGVLLRWAPAGGNVIGYLVSVSGPVTGTIPVAGTQLFAQGPPAGGYTYTVTAVGPGGVQSAPSAPVSFSPTAGPGTVPTPVITASVYGTYVDARWSAVPGAVSYTVEGLQNGVSKLATPVPASVTSLRQLGVQFLPLATYQLRVSANASCGSSAQAQGTFVVDGAPPPGPRAANPAPGDGPAAPGLRRERGQPGRRGAPRSAAAVVPRTGRQQPLAVRGAEGAPQAGHALGPQLEARQRRRHVAGHHHLQRRPRPRRGRSQPLHLHRRHDRRPLRRQPRTELGRRQRQDRRRRHDRASSRCCPTSRPATPRSALARVVRRPGRQRAVRPLSCRQFAGSHSSAVFPPRSTSRPGWEPGASPPCPKEPCT